LSAVRMMLSVIFQISVSGFWVKPVSIQKWYIVVRIKATG
jgi:hypothetical protein